MLRRILLVLRQWWWIAAIIAFALLGGGSWWLWHANQTSLAPVASNKQSYPSVTVGQTTAEQLRLILDTPASSFQKDGYEVVLRPSSKSPYQPDRFYIKDGVVQMKEQWFEPTVYQYKESDFVSIYGAPEKTLYDQAASDEVTKVLAYPRQGLAGYVYERLHLVRKIQFFPPMTLQEYQASWGKNVGPQPSTTLKAEPAAPR